MGQTITNPCKYVAMLCMKYWKDTFQWCEGHIHKFQLQGVLALRYKDVWPSFLLLKSWGQSKVKTTLFWGDYRIWPLSPETIRITLVPWCNPHTLPCVTLTYPIAQTTCQQGLNQGGRWSKHYLMRCQSCPRAFCCVSEARYKLGETCQHKVLLSAKQRECKYL